MNFRDDFKSLIHLSRYFDRNLTSLEPTRQKQDVEFVKYIRNKALEKIGSWPKIAEPQLFYVGSVDFMVTEYNGKRKFVILETNGGSSRGIFSTSVDQIEIIHRAFKNAIDQNRSKPQTRVLIGSLPRDDLYQEKIVLGEYLRQNYEHEGYKVGIYNCYNYFPAHAIEEDIILIFSNYDNIQRFISYQNQHITFKNKEIHVLIGDGIARRYPIIGEYIKDNWKEVKTRIINTIYHITDDKASTYVATFMGRNILDKFRVQPLQFARVFDQHTLKNILEAVITENKKDFVIKPYGGSGGAGIKPIIRNSPIADIPKIIAGSISEFQQKFNKARDPFPYTIQEMAQFNLIDWNNSKRTFDLRLYVIQDNGFLIPVGGSFRVAKAPYTGKFTKDEFIVNICGEWGVDFERALGISPKYMKILGLNEEDLIDMFCAACQIFHIICEKYSEILSFNQWEKYLKFK